MTRKRSRRALLRTGALAVGSLAGCVGSLGDGSDGPETTPTTRETTTGGRTRTTHGGTTTGEAPAPREPRDVPPPVDLRPVSVQSSFFYRKNPGAVDVRTVEGVQFAFVSVHPQTASPLPSNIALVADGRRFWGTLAPGDVGGPHLLVEQGPGYRYENAAAGWIAFEVPNPLDAEEVALTHDGREWQVGGAFRAALRSPPTDFELRAFEAPDEVPPSGPFEVSFAVENVGGTDGTFRASLNQSGPTDAPHRTELPVHAGEVREQTMRIADDLTAETERVGLRFRSTAADRQATVEVDAGTTTRG